MSGISNEDIVRLRKALIDSGGTLASGGKLNPAQEEEFLDFFVDETSLTKMGQVHRFRPEQKYIDILTVSGRKTIAVEEGVDPGHRFGVSTSRITLTPKEFMTPLNLTYDFIQHNVEGDGGEDHVVRLMAGQHGNDLEECAIEADALGPAALEDDILPNGSTTEYVRDGFMAQFDGWLTQARSGNLLDAATEAIGIGLVSDMLQQLPTKYQRRMDRLRLFIPVQLYTILGEKVAARQGDLGDAAVRGVIPPIMGVPVVPTNLMAFNPTTVEHITFTGSGSSVTLLHAPIANVVVTSDDLGTESDAPFTLTTDYTVNLTTGVITHAGGGSTIGTTETVKVTYTANPQAILTHANNFIFAIGRDITIEREREIFGRRVGFAITSKIDAKIQELDALVLAKNIKATA